MVWIQTEKGDYINVNHVAMFSVDKERDMWIVNAWIANSKTPVPVTPPRSNASDTVQDLDALMREVRR